MDLLKELLVERKAVRTMADTFVIGVAFPTSDTAILIACFIALFVIALAGTVFSYQRVSRSLAEEITTRRIGA